MAVQLQGTANAQALSAPAKLVIGEALLSFSASAMPVRSSPRTDAGSEMMLTYEGEHHGEHWGILQAFSFLSMKGGVWASRTVVVAGHQQALALAPHSVAYVVHAQEGLVSLSLMGGWSEGHIDSSRASITVPALILRQESQTYLDLLKSGSAGLVRDSGTNRSIVASVLDVGDVAEGGSERSAIVGSSTRECRRG